MCPFYCALYSVQYCVPGSVIRLNVFLGLCSSLHGLRHVQLAGLDCGLFEHRLTCVQHGLPIVMYVQIQMHAFYLQVYTYRYRYYSIQNSEAEAAKVDL